jgi:hypothetical protein
MTEREGALYYTDRMRMTLMRFLIRAPSGVDAKAHHGPFQLPRGLAVSGGYAYVLEAGLGGCEGSSCITVASGLSW